MSTLKRSRPLPVGHLRAFAAVARHLNFRLAAEELALTQSAVSRQIQALEDDVGTPLFRRHTRAVTLTSAGADLARTVNTTLDTLDATVRRIRQHTGRRSVAVSTWASFASIWLIPRLEAFQAAHPDIDIRIDATDAKVDLATADVDLALRYGTPDTMGADATPLFGEELTPVASPWLVPGAPLPGAHALAELTWIEAGDAYRTMHLQWLSWERWLQTHVPRGQTITPKRWLYFNYAQQIIQAAVAGQGVALARTPLVAEHLANGSLVEPLPGTRLSSPLAYWLVLGPQGRQRPEVDAFCTWLLEQAAQTRHAIGLNIGLDIGTRAPG